MISIVQRKLMPIAESLHLRFFGYEMSDVMRSFIGHLSWSFFGGIFAGGLFFMANVLAGRWLGPVGYGKFSFIFSLSFFISLPMILGVDAAIIRHANGGKKQIGKSISNGVLLVAVFILISSLALFFYPFVSKKTGINVNFLYIAFIVAFLFALRSVTDAIVRRMYLFKEQSLARTIESSVVIIFFGVSYHFGNNYFYYVLSIGIGLSLIHI